MPRIRTIKPGFFTDEKVALLPFPVRLLFIGLWCLADDEGRMKYRPGRIRNELFPEDEVDIDALVKMLVDQSMVALYEVDGDIFLAVIKFSEHQRISHPTPSTLPPLPEDSGVLAKTPECSRKNSLEGKGREGEGKGGGKERIGRKETKKKYAERISLTESEYKKLIERFGKKNALDRIEALSLYKRSKNRRYASDYATILNWARRDANRGTQDRRVLPDDEELTRKARSMGLQER